MLAGAARGGTGSKGGGGLVRSLDVDTRELGLQCWLKATLFISLLHLYSPAMSTGSSQVGAVLSFTHRGRHVIIILHWLLAIKLELLLQICS